MKAELLTAYLAKQRWFGGKGRQLQSTEIVDNIPLRGRGVNAQLLIVRVIYASGADEIYAMPVLDKERLFDASVDDSTRLKMDEATTAAGLALTDALRDEQFLTMLLEAISSEAVSPGAKGDLRGFRTGACERLVQPALAGNLKPKALTGEQSNSSVIYGEKLILKFFRRIEEGINPEVEIGKFLTERARYGHMPAFGGWLEYRTNDGKHMVQATLQAFVPNQGDGWRYTQRSLRHFYELATRQPGASVVVSGSVAGEEPKVPAFARELVDPYLKLAGLLGARTAELHGALASETSDPAFAPEPFTMEFQQELNRSLRELTGKVLALLHEKMASLPPEWREKAKVLADRKDEITQRFESILAGPIRAARTRIHGDYHLGQVLYTGSDFVIIDFEGEPARSLAERRVKRSPLQDVAGMLRSFHYAALAPLLGAASEEPGSIQEFARLSDCAEAWYSWVARRFLVEYFEHSREATYLPRDSAQTYELLELHLLEKAIYELGYELNNRPSWIGIPLEGISRLLSAIH